MVGRVDDIVGGVLGELLQENFLFYRTIADVSARSWCGGEPVDIRRRSVRYARSSLSRICGTANERCLPAITHGLGEWEDVGSGAGAECGVHQHVDVYHRRLLEAVIEPRRRIHGSS